MLRRHDAASDAGERAGRRSGLTAGPTEGLNRGPPLELTGILGWAESVLTALGAWGVGPLVALETVFPPIPSEVILPLAGYLAGQGQLSLPLVLVTATLGSYVGALALYGLGAAVGLERSIKGMSKLPLMDREDIEKAAKWFDRHGKASIFFGRLFPESAASFRCPPARTG